MSSRERMTQRKSNRELFDLTGRVVILTGAAGQLGPEYADALNEAGANVVLTDVAERLPRSQELAKALQDKYGTSPAGLTMDLFRKESIDKAVAEVVQRYGKIDILVNNAAYNPITADSQAPFEEYRLDIWEKVLAVDLTGVFLCCQVVGRVMVQQGHGVIVNIGSVYGMVGADQRIYGTSGLNSSVAYAAAKGAVINLTRYLAAYWQGKNIRVNSLSPGGVYNPGVQNEEFLQNYCYRTMLGRMAASSDLRGAMLFLCSDASDFITGANLVVDAGWTAW
ncbi:MAG: SDR family oxidoreductase [Dehalococcoidia bacterium]